MRDDGRQTPSLHANCWSRFRAMKTCRVSKRLLLRPGGGAFILGLVVTACLTVRPAPADEAAVTRAMIVAASTDDEIASWYREAGYRRIWTGVSPGDVRRRQALFAALETAPDHGLPEARYDAKGLKEAFKTARTAGDVGRLEIGMARAYLAWARDVSTGLLDPGKTDPTIVREIARAEPEALLDSIAANGPVEVLRELLPRSNSYAELARARLDLLEIVATGGWGAPIAGDGLKPGHEGDEVVALRDRLIRMGYLPRSATRQYDRTIRAAISRFQAAHDLPETGIADAGTLAEINISPVERLKSITIAMERERWMRIDRSGYMIWVNLPEFSTRIMADGLTEFRTRSVIGREDIGRRTPEFSDEMAHMVVNPSWNVPRSIIVQEYLPQLRKNPNAIGHLQVVDRRGQAISRGSVNFNAYSDKSFPFGMRQPPGTSNALGRIKFMFPNKYNIYLHDTPSKSLFNEERRAFSHGCIRLADPIDFAHNLLRIQTGMSDREFRTILDSGRESSIPLRQKIPIHLVYFTAYPEARGRIHYWRDVYQRDERLWASMAAAGVEVPALSR